MYLTLKLFIINILLGIYVGKSGLVAFGICYNSLFILYIFLIGTAQTMSPIVSVYFKEEDFSGVDYVIHRSLKIVLVSSLALSVLFIVYPQSLLMLYSVKNPVDVPVVLNALRIFAISYVGTAITFLYTFSFHCLKDWYCLLDLQLHCPSCLVEMEFGFPLHWRKYLQ